MASKNKTEIVEPTLITAEQVAEAKSVYDAAKKSVNACIEANQAAMRAFQADRTAENKAAYEATRAAHRASIDHIKTVRPIFKDLKSAFDQQTATTTTNQTTAA